jgi:hypothetical protein
MITVVFSDYIDRLSIYTDPLLITDFDKLKNNFPEYHGYMSNYLIICWGKIREFFTYYCYNKDKRVYFF